MRELELERKLVDLKCKLSGFILLTCAFIVSFFLALCANVHASDMRNDKHPTFMNVKRVYIHVDYQVWMDEGENIPDILKRENIEKRFIKMYTKRFSSTECADFFKTRTIPLNPYECNDQPVISLSGKDSRDFIRGRETRFSEVGEINDEGTLYINLQVRFNGNSRAYEPSLEIPIVSFLFMQERPALELPRSVKRPMLWVFPINQTSEKIQQHFDSIRGYIH